MSTNSVESATGLGPAYERGGGAELRDPVGPAVRGAPGALPASGPTGSPGREPGGERRRRPTDARSSATADAGPRTHRVAEQHHRDGAVGGTHLVQRPARVGDRGGARRAVVPADEPVAQQPDVESRRRGSARCSCAIISRDRSQGRLRAVHELEVRPRRRRAA